MNTFIITSVRFIGAKRQRQHVPITDPTNDRIRAVGPLQITAVSCFCLL